MSLDSIIVVGALLAGMFFCADELVNRVREKLDRVPHP